MKKSNKNRKWEDRSEKTKKYLIIRVLLASILFFCNVIAVNAMEQNNQDTNWKENAVEKLLEAGASYEDITEIMKKIGKAGNKI